VRLKAQRKAIRLREDLKLTKLDLRTLLQKDYPDKGAIHKKFEERGNLRTMLEKNWIDARLEVRNLLTVEQRRKLRQVSGELSRERRRRWLMRKKSPSPCRNHRHPNRLNLEEK